MVKGTGYSPCALRRADLPAFLFALVATFAAACHPKDTDDLETTTVENGVEIMKFKRIGVIRSPYTPETGAPRQGGLAQDVASTIVVDASYEPGLTDIETFSHIIVLYAFDRSRGWSPMVRTPWEETPHGVFATRSPRRPNPIGMTVVRLVKRDGATLLVQGMDAFDGTPVLDLKPYVPKFDRIEAAGGGWLRNAGEAADEKR